jgi:phage tail sheath gpL-like
VFSAWYQRVGLAVRDATNLGVWETNTDNKAGPLEGRPEHVTCASNDTLSNWTSVAQTTLNNGRFCALWMLNGESDPAEMAAFFAALRAVTEQGDPNTDYDGAVLTGIAPHSQTADIPQRATKVSALQNSVTPITTEDNSAKVVRAITTRSLNGTTPDYRCLDTNQAVTPDTFRVAVGLRWLAYKTANPIVADDPAPEQPDRPSGVATPSRWNSEVEKVLRDFEAGRGFSSGLPQCIDVDLNKPASGYDKAAKRIMTLAPIVPAPRHHQVGVSVRQL